MIVLRIVVVLAAVAIGHCAAADVVLSSDYSRKAGSAVLAQLTTDGQGSAYLLADDTSVAKYSATGERLWLSSFGFAPVTMAADSSGILYAAAVEFATRQMFIARMSADGVMSASRINLGIGLTPKRLIVDSRNRVWLCGVTSTDHSSTLAVTPGAFQTTLPAGNGTHSFLLRLDASASSVEYATYVAGSYDDEVSTVAVDPMGAAYLLGTTSSPDFPLTFGSVSGAATFLLRLTADGTRPAWSVIVGAPNAGQLVVDSAGEATVTLTAPNYGERLYHFRADGTVAFTKSGIGFNLGLDPAGNIYAAGDYNRGNRPVKNTTAACWRSFLSVFSSSGELLQATWLPPQAGTVNGMAVSGSAVFVQGLEQVAIPITTILTRLSQKATFVRQTLSLACVTDAAIYQVPGTSAPNPGFYSNVPNGIAPGELVTLFGTGLGPENARQPDGVPLPKELAGVQVTFDGTQAPLLYVQDAQINAIAPWGLATGQDSQVCVTYGAARTNCIRVPMVDSGPAVFTSDGTNAIAVNQDGSVNSADHPAPRGSVVTIWATGLGPIRPVPDDGAVIGEPLPANQFPVTATTVDVYGKFGPRINTWEVPYSGPAPGMAAGVSQINLRIPADDQSGGPTRDVYLNVADVVGKLTLFIGSSK